MRAEKPAPTVTMLIFRRGVKAGRLPIAVSRRISGARALSPFMLSTRWRWYSAQGSKEAPT